jgi:hypothetical protein
MNTQHDYCIAQSLKFIAKINIKVNKKQQNTKIIILKIARFGATFM